MSSSLRITLTLVLLTASASAVGQSVSLADATDVAALCAYAAPVEAAFPALCDGALADIQDAVWPEPEAPTQPSAAAVRMAYQPPAELPEEVPAHPPEDRVQMAMQARTYAQDRVDALFRTYEVVVPASAFGGWSWDEDAASVVALVDEPLEIFNGAFALELEDASVLYFPMDEADTADLFAGLAVDAISVRLEFLLSARAEPWTDVCGFDDQVARMNVQAVSAELHQGWGDAVAGRAFTNAYDAVQVREVAQRSGVAPTAAPRVEVTSLDVESRSGCTHDDQSILRASVESVMTECYMMGLARNASLRGVLVFSFDIDASGRAADPVLQIDAMNDPLVTDCARASLDRLTVPREDAADALSVRASVSFTRQE